MSCHGWLKKKETTLVYQKFVRHLYHHFYEFDTPFHPINALNPVVFRAVPPVKYGTARVCWSKNHPVFRLQEIFPSPRST